MTELKEAKFAVKSAKAKMKRAQAAVKASRKHGSEKQINLCERRFKAATKAYNEALKSYSELKAAQPGAWARIKETPVKKVATWTGLAIAVVATAIGAAIIIDKTGGNGDETETASDSV